MNALKTQLARTAQSRIDSANARKSAHNAHAAYIRQIVGFEIGKAAVVTAKARLDRVTAELNATQARIARAA
jgi:hypothetical protein